MERIIRRFRLPSPMVSCAPLGHGHINTSYHVRTQHGPDCLLQRISTQAFHNVPALMRNIAQVTSFLALRDRDPRHTLRLIPTLDGQPFCAMPDGQYYRMYLFIEDTLCLEEAQNPRDLYACAYAFGNFLRRLSGFPAATLYETIPHFHDTPARYAALKAAVAADCAGRAAFCRDEIAFALSREQDAPALTRQLACGALPLRVTHNDTKLSNVLLDRTTREPVCVVDLDTVMPGLAAYDFGDLVRTGAGTGAEDERDLSRVNWSMERYTLLLDGFLDACGDTLTEDEVRSLPLGGKLMTLECGVRFLTDYLCGDRYFHIRHPEQNLDRCRTQFRLVRCMEDNWPAMTNAARHTRSASGGE